MNDFINGYITGISQVIIGYPLDTMVVYRQSGKKINSIKFKTIFYGIKYPLLSNGFITSISFGLSYKIYKYTDNHYISGAITGFATSFIISPIEFYKIRSQRLLPINISIFTGLQYTIFKKIISSSIYFGLYNTLQPKIDNVLISGGITGCLSNLISYPIDVIKTQAQCGKNIAIKTIFNRNIICNGILLSLTRSFIVNSVGFYIFEKLKNH